MVTSFRGDGSRWLCEGRKYAKGAGLVRCRRSNAPEDRRSSELSVRWTRERRCARSGWMRKECDVRYSYVDGLGAQVLLIDVGSDNTEVEGAGGRVWDSPGSPGEGSWRGPIQASRFPPKTRSYSADWPPRRGAWQVAATGGQCKRLGEFHGWELKASRRSPRFGVRGPELRLT